mgnify:CR=1 FL=1
MFKETFSHLSTQSIGREQSMINTINNELISEIKKALEDEERTIHSPDVCQEFKALYKIYLDKGKRGVKHYFQKRRIEMGGIILLDSLLDSMSNLTKGLRGMEEKWKLQTMLDQYQARIQQILEKDSEIQQSRKLYLSCLNEIADQINMELSKHYF